MASTYEEKELVDNIGGSGIAAEYSGYAVRASKDENGNDIMSTYATKYDLGSKVDTLTPASANNLAALDSNGQLTEVALTVVNNSITAIGGKTITGTESVFLAFYGSTRGDAITAALSNNKIVISVFSDGYHNHFGFMTYSDRNSHKYGFTCIEKTSNQMEQAPGNIQFDGWFCQGAGPSWYGQHNKMVLPAPGSNDVGKVLRAYQMPNSNNYNYRLETINGLPSSTTYDSGKMLGVDSLGNAGWLTFENLGLMKARTNLVAGPRVTYLDINISPAAGVFTYQTNNGVQYNYYGVPYTPSTMADGQVLMYNSNSGPYWATIPEQLPSSTSADEGKLLTVNSEGTPSWEEPTKELPPIVAGDEDKFLRVSTSGVPAWDNPFEKSSWGTVITDTENNPMADEQGNLIFDENEVDLWTTFNGTGFGAERAAADVEGNPIVDTYAKKSEVPDVSRFQQKLITDTVTATPSVNVDNNTVTSITINAGDNISAMTINCNISEGDCPNLAVEIDNQSSTDCTITVIKNNVAGSLKKSAATNGKVAGGKFCQMTCVGKCWTMAEFN